jgi:alkylhydroperoxidase family enzyme
MTPRIAPIEPPYSSEVQAALDKWMPPNAGVPPLALFRTLARHPLLFERMRPVGAALLGRGALPPRVRELLILRTCARCGAEYEWGVHVAAFADAVGIDFAGARATASDPAVQLAARDDDDARVMHLADELHDTGAVSDATWGALTARFDEAALLEMVAVVGFYHLISYVANAARVAPEAWAARFPVSACP